MGVTCGSMPLICEFPVALDTYRGVFSRLLLLLRSKIVRNRLESEAAALCGEREELYRWIADLRDQLVRLGHPTALGGDVRSLSASRARA